MFILLFSLKKDVIIGFSLGTYNVSESAGFVRVTVMVREGQLDRDVFVTLQTANGSAVCKLDL